MTHVGCSARKCAKFVCSVRTVADPYLMQKAIHTLGSVVAKYHLTLLSPTSFSKFEK